MGVDERRERHRQKLRRDILDAAGELFAKEGFASVSMRRISDRIEYSPGVIYLHFKDKSELLRELCDDVFARLVERLKTETERAKDPAEGLQRVCRAYIEFGLEYPHHYLVTFGQPLPEGGPDIPFEGSNGEEAFRWLERTIERSIQARRLPDTDVRKTATICWAAVHGLTSLLITHEGFPWPDRDQLIDEMLRCVLTGLGVEEAPS